MEIVATRLNVAEIAAFRRQLRDNKIVDNELCRDSFGQAFEKAGIRNFENLLMSDLDPICKKIGIAPAVKMRLKALQGTTIDPEATASASDIIALVQITNKREAVRPVGGPMETIKTHRTLMENSTNKRQHLKSHALMLSVMACSRSEKRLQF